MRPARYQVTLVPLFLAFVATAASAEDWSVWRGPRGDGTWIGPILPPTWPAGGLHCRWRQPIGGGYAGSAVAGGRVFTMDREKQPAAGPNAPDGVERIVCLDAATGKPLWNHSYATRSGELGGYANGPRAMPTVHDGRVYTLGAVGHLHCLDAGTGKVLWSHDTVREYHARVPEWGFAAAPVVYRDRVIVHVGAQPDGCLIAFDRLSGKEVWRSLADPAGYATPVFASVRGHDLLIAWTPENVHGLDPATGRRLWSVPYKVTYGVSIATPLVRDDIVFVTGYWEGSKAIRLGERPTEAHLLWEDTRNLRGLMCTPLSRDGFAYSLDKRDGLVCFELATGKKRWDDHRVTPRGRNPQMHMVWLGDGDRALILNAAGELILARLRPDGYREESRTRLVDEAVWSHPGLGGRSIFVRTDGGEAAPQTTKHEILCFELAPSHPKGTHP